MSFLAYLKGLLIHSFHQKDFMISFCYLCNLHSFKRKRIWFVYFLDAAGVGETKGNPANTPTLNLHNHKIDR